LEQVPMYTLTPGLKSGVHFSAVGSPIPPSKRKRARGSPK